MDRLIDFQSRFSVGLRGREPGPPDGLFDGNELRLQAGWQVYQNNVFHSLTEALKDTFPVVCRLVGDEFFRALAGEFVQHQVPGNPVLLEYGEGFADFLASFEPVQAYPYLVDVGRLEYSWLAAYHAKDAAPLTAQDFDGIAPEKMAGLRFTLHPSVHLLSSAVPVHSIWQAHQGDGDISVVDLDSGGDNVLISRPFWQVAVETIDTGLLGFLATLESGSTLQQAHETALTAALDFDLEAAIGALLSKGLLSGFEILKA